jgi:hypothetical protein
MKKAFSISSPSSLEGLSPFSPLSLALRFPEALAGSRPGRLVLSFRQFDALPLAVQIGGLLNSPNPLA